MRSFLLAPLGVRKTPLVVLTQSRCAQDYTMCFPEAKPKDLHLRTKLRLWMTSLRSFACWAQDDVPEILRLLGSG